MVNWRKLSVLVALLAFALLANWLPLVTHAPIAHAQAAKSHQTMLNSLPSWWSGDCDKNNIPAAKLIGTWNGIQVCEPAVTNVSGIYGNSKWSVPLFQCTELVARYLYQVYGYSSVKADGGQVVDQYVAAYPNLHKLMNDANQTAAKIMPAAGDVISFSSGGPNQYASEGHVAIVGSVSNVNNGAGSETITLIEQNWNNGHASMTRQIAVTNWHINDTVAAWMTTRNVSVLPLPTGWWTPPMPTDYTPQTAGAIPVSFHAVDNGNGGLDHVNIGYWSSVDRAWHVLPIMVSNASSSSEDVTATVPAMVWSTFIEITAEVYSKNGTYQKAPNGLKHYCFPTTMNWNTWVQNGLCVKSLFPDYSSGGSGGGSQQNYDPNQVALCLSTNLNAPCQNYGLGNTYNDVTSFTGTTMGSVKSIHIPAGQVLYVSSGKNRTGNPGYWNGPLDINDTSQSGGWSLTLESLQVGYLYPNTCNAIRDGVVLIRNSYYDTSSGCLPTTTSISDLSSWTQSGFSSLQIVGSFIYSVKVSLFLGTDFQNLCGVYYVNQSDLGKCGHNGSWVRSVEIESYTMPAKAQNIASLATRDRSGTDSVVDGNLATGWIAPDRKSHLGFVFSSPQTIQDITVFDTQPKATGVFLLDLSFSDGTIIRKVDMVPQGVACADVSFPAKTVSWVNVYTDDNSGAGFGEIQIWDNSGSVYDQNNCVNKTQQIPQPGIGQTPAGASLSPTSGWIGQYYPNDSLSGDPSFTRMDPNPLNFYWGSASPDPSLTVGNYSVRWTRVDSFAAGTYRFSVISNDGLRFSIDGKIVLDAWYDKSPNEFIYIGYLSAGIHTLTFEYYDHGIPEAAMASYQPISVGSGYIAQYYDNTSLSGTPRWMQIDPSVSFTWASESSLWANQTYSARWTKTDTFASGNYQFTVTASMGVRLFVDGQLVIDQWNSQGGTYSITLALSAGQHTIVAEYDNVSVTPIASLTYTRV